MANDFFLTPVVGPGAFTGCLDPGSKFKVRI
jgi:hypothetical protein